MKRELLEEVVVETSPRLDPHARGSVERQPNRKPGLSSGTQNTNFATASQGHRRRAVEQPRERLDEHVVVDRVEHRHADRLGISAHNDSPLQQQLAQRDPVRHGT